jgi:hypothetical protein
VKRLRALANDAEARHDESIEFSDYEEMSNLNDLADRIEALLPPPEIFPGEIEARVCVRRWTP